MFLKLKDIPVKEILPGFHGKFVHSEKFTTTFWEIEAGALLPEHQHFHEQTSQVVEGELEFTLEGETQILKPGDFVVIPSNAIHSGKALTFCKVIDVFCPVREEYK